MTFATEAVLTVQDLHTSFDSREGQVHAVNGVSFEVNPHQPHGLVGLVGESGSGKSALSLSLMRLLPVPPARYAGGSVRFLGHSLLDLDESRMCDLRGNKIAMIFQDPMTALNPYLTVERQLTETLMRHRGLSYDDCVDQSAAMLMEVGIQSARQRLAQYPHQLSGGLRQRVMIAMALLCNPALIIADEPTTALDVTIAAQILALLRRMQKASGQSLLLVTHDLGVVAGLCDRVMVMYAGRIVEHARAADLFARPLHPYTRALIGCIPRLHGPRTTRLTPIPGTPPNLATLLPGCPFAPRCPRVQEACAGTPPPRVPGANGQWALCHNPEPPP